MTKRAKSIFQGYLLRHLSGETVDLSPDLQGLPLEEAHFLNRKFAVLRSLEKLFQRLPSMETPAARPEESLERPKTLGGCQIIRKLGQGGMGVVYLGFQESLNRNVAIKVLSPFASENVSLLRRFKQEGQLIASLDHPYLVPIYDVGEENGVYFIIMKYLEGITLRELIEALKGKDRAHLRMEDLREIFERNLKTSSSTPLQLPGKNPIEFFCLLILKVARAVEYIHAKGIVHRDIKPTNIMIPADFEPVLLDFGLGKREGEALRTVSGEFLGTPIYSAPETFQGKDPKDLRRLDVYSLGMTLYELLTGFLPYEGDSLYEVYTNLKTKEPDRPSHHWKGLPSDLETVLLKAISKDPYYRYASILSFREDLERFLNYRPILAKPPSFFQRSRFFLKRHRWGTLILSLILLGAGALGFGLHAQRQFQKAEQERTYLAVLADFDKLRREKRLNFLRELERGNLQAIQAELEHRLGTGVLRMPPERALVELKEKLAADPDNIVFLEWAAKVYLDQGDYEQARRMAERILTLDPRNEIAYILLYQISILHAEDLAGAMALVRRFNQSFPQRVGGNGLLGVHCLLRENYPCAIEFLNLASRQDPKTYLPLLGVAQGRSGNFTKGIELFQAALKYSPSDPDLYFALAVAFGRLDRWNEALGYAQKALALAPQDPLVQKLNQSIQGHNRLYPSNP